MFEKTIREICTMLDVKNDPSAFDPVIVKGVSIDTRKIGSGNLFVPFKGENVDGHEFVRQAIDNGASAALWDINVPNPPEDIPVIVVEDPLLALQSLANQYRHELDLKVVGITGSNGKTTTKDIVANLLSVKYRVHKTQGNYNNHIGLPLTILSLPQDSEVAVLEMGMSGFGEIELLSEISQPDAAIITNIGESHLQDLGSREGIAKAKLEIVKGLKPDGLFAYYGDEPLLQEGVKGIGLKNMETFGRSESNNIYPTKIEMNNQGSYFETSVAEGETFFLPVLGQHNIHNALAGILIARHFGLTVEEMKEGLQSLKLTQMRMEMVEGKKGESIINDAYNASPTSMKAAIGLVSELEGFRTKILVLGDMLELGDQEEEFHQEIGHLIDQEKIQQVFTFGRLGTFIAKGALENFPEERVHSYMDKESLAQELSSLIKGDELILFKASRGMKLEEIIEGLKG
ncbi:MULTISPECIES: UDP-N-acetylmuramoyl-tripeptide--D-alanyl-D-alanine ligase [unclassified Rossellomorea]|uniref:UDP-N-acetylmuramoyl-tripeptide--D-alanyl-D- alanine ligase n=1 Tax=unclassified Rossellomorea TaxID=2837526 RepID=UPI0020C60EBD|nr:MULTISPECIES: UDP-N-acetylmuramoyl-tripeptide--D-alanyl-D-alanine ligase [unclassified Rossellomorea]UTE77943.1 UDP-N-acetylmuramoyl-tripeptide--D-alanyl-D-alanine ligase [Rossellomorea sp. KS-H15a]WGG45922.1 UDP-N-acetylmuramoyl-tripeptide--D-alanyl-D-alanine ligase [Rossellomorea sp. DA94]